MPKLNMTDTQAAKLPHVKGNETLYADTGCRNLMLSVKPSGQRTWIARFFLDGKQRRMTIGAYPALSTALARTKMLPIHQAISEGRNPAEEKKAAKAERIEAYASGTIAAVAETYMAAIKIGKHKRNGRPLRDGSIRNHAQAARTIIPMIGGRPMKDLTRRELEGVIVTIETDQSAGTARLVHSFLSGLYGYAIWQDIVTVNPMVAIAKATPEARETVATPAQMAALFKALDDEPPVSAGLVMALKLCAFTAQRAGEVAGITMAELDLDRQIWTIPGSRTKNHRSHVVPLSDKAVELIRSQIGDNAKTASAALFPSPTDASVPVTPKALTRAFVRMRATAADLDGLRLHDLRRTAATNMAQAGVPTSHISRVLNHTDGTGAAVTAVYNRYDYLDEKRAALDTWASKLDAMAGSVDGANVVNLRAM